TRSGLERGVPATMPIWKMRVGSSSALALATARPTKRPAARNRQALIRSPRRRGPQGVDHSLPWGASGGDPRGQLVSMVRRPLGSTAVDFAVECEWLGREKPPFVQPFESGSVEP